jgi:hypothetical protein
MLNDVDVALNQLDALRAQERQRRRRAEAHADTVHRIDGALRKADAIAATISANLQNDQDNDFLTDMLRERVQALIGAMDGSSAPPTAAQMRERDAVEVEFRLRMHDVSAYVSGDVARLNGALRASGVPPVAPNAPEASRDRPGAS